MARIETAANPMKLTFFAKAGEFWFDKQTLHLRDMIITSSANLSVRVPVKQARVHNVMED